MFCTSEYSTIACMCMHNDIPCLLFSLSSEQDQHDMLCWCISEAKGFLRCDNLEWPCLCEAHVQTTCKLETTCSSPIPPCKHNVCTFSSAYLFRASIQEIIVLVNKSYKNKGRQDITQHTTSEKNNTVSMCIHMRVRAYTVHAWDSAWLLTVQTEQYEVD